MRTKYTHRKNNFITLSKNMACVLQAFRQFGASACPQEIFKTLIFLRLCFLKGCLHDPG